MSFCIGRGYRLSAFLAALFDREIPVCGFSPSVPGLDGASNAMTIAQTLDGSYMAALAILILKRFVERIVYNAQHAL